MAFIEKKDPIVLNIKLTSKGRELLSSGDLNFKYYAMGDSEIDYKFNKSVNDVDNEFTAFDSSILGAVDKNPNLISFIPQNLDGDVYNELTNVPSTPYTVINETESIGFFTDNNTEYIIDSNHVKQPDAMIDMEYVNGGNVITLKKGPLYGRSGEEPLVGDVLFVKWTKYVDTTDFKVNKEYPRVNLFYKIIEVLEGTLADNSVIVRVDRDIPDFSSLGLVYKAGVMVYYNTIDFSGDTTINMSSTEYLNESVISFLENNQCPTIVFPFWNMSILYTEEIAGVSDDNQSFTQFENRKFGGFVSYIQNQSSTIKKMGVIHYTNSSSANVYGEGFVKNTPVLDIPTIMWHNSSTTELGVKLSSTGSQKLLDGLDLYYYDLADQQNFVVGKVFPDLKIFVIEDPELLFAMSYKSNRSWSLPNYETSTSAIINVGVTEGIAVTWKYPTTDINDISFNSVSYCHADSNWQTLSVGEEVTCVGVYNAAYCIDALTTSVSNTILTATDNNNGTVINSTSKFTDAGDSLIIEMNNVNWGTNYTFDANIIEGYKTTWSYPTNVNNNVSFTDVSYCHSGSDGWVNLSPDEKVTCYDVYNTGFRATGTYGDYGYGFDLFAADATGSYLSYASGYGGTTAELIDENWDSNVDYYGYAY